MTGSLQYWFSSFQNVLYPSNPMVKWPCNEPKSRVQGCHVQKKKKQWDEENQYWLPIKDEVLSNYIL